MELSNVRRKSKETTKCEKKTITYDIGTTQCEDEAFKCEKKVRESPMWQKNYHMWQKYSRCDVGTT